MKTLLGCCKLYISETRNGATLEAIEQAAAKLYPKTAVVNKFEDTAYNRVGYTLVSDFASAASIRKIVFDMVRIALEQIDLRLHTGTHPRLGVIDHICFHPLETPSSLDDNIHQPSAIAKSVATDIGNKLQVPVFLYGGAARQQGKALDSIRRELGYFRPNSTRNHQWVGGFGNSMPLNPDQGPSEVLPAKGVVLIGATSWVDNYNVPLWSTDMTIAKRIARKVSERGGGLPSVQAMALTHGDDSIEVACNLLKPEIVSAHQVQLQIESLATKEGLIAGKGYFTDLPKETIVENYMNSATTSF
ncbi:Formimidoyltetrahydrofolate cyclodeaminase, Glutamate formimidoyltransferase [Zostera marina]|uniref:glutamate formimidoyltransferase n=1 Tax=Zostera marina TaxID=29655 RepID=A0A0K9P830_ZOSMR|nr:Formimidoyltetrahydrofolate cyclodeaminase, Glutamate formimidoyltransferase [Zostera marina]